MIEFVKSISSSEKRSGYLNLTDIKGYPYGHLFPPHRTPLWIITAGRKYMASKDHKTQIWGSAKNWFYRENIQPDDTVRIRYDLKESPIQGRIPVYISRIESEENQETENEMGEVSLPDTDKDKGSNEVRRVECISNHIVRDAILAHRIKELYQHVCQLCRTIIEIGERERYSEIHHIKPLGAPHHGPDIQENVLCVCPNCHVRLDYGAIELDVDKITFIASHSVSEEYIHYHNELILNRARFNNYLNVIDQ